jgi:hypothetical protein
MGDTVWSVLIGVIILAIIFMLVRPNSPTLQAVNDISDSLAALISTATNNYGGNSSG